MKFAVVTFGLEDIAEKISELYPEADVFHGLDEIEVEYYEFVFLMSELGGAKGDQLISAIESLECEMIIFCITSTTLEGLIISRHQVQKILDLKPQFRGAIISGFLSFEDKMEVVKILLDERISEADG
uniref:Uncharacterized protein n=1 Tax=Geoglobus ahangari TaxID=113653 RepID=A0A7C3YEE7_9EURY